MINGFESEYFFLSNYYESPVVYEGIMYRSAEAAFQAQKCTNQEDRKSFSDLSPRAAKYKGRHVRLRDDWENVKDDIMFKICWNKFIQSPDLAKRLIDTYPEELVEENDWGDRYWGKVNGVGENILGKILMGVRCRFIEISIYDETRD